MAGPFVFPEDNNYKAGAVVSFYGDNEFTVPMANIAGIPILLTNSPLTASSEYAQNAQDRIGDNVLINFIRGHAFTDQQGTMYIEESETGSSWDTLKTVNVSTNELADTGWVELSKKLYRLRYVNGSTDQGTFNLYESFGFDEVPNYGSNNQIGNDLTFTWADSDTAGTQQTNTIAKPAILQPNAKYLVTIVNPSTETSIDVKLQNQETSLGGSTRYPKVQQATVATDDEIVMEVTGWMLGDGDSRIVMENNSDLSSSGGFSAYVRVRKINA